MQGVGFRYFTQDAAAREGVHGWVRNLPDGSVEAIRALMVAKRSARGERTRSVNQARALVTTGPRFR